MRLVKLPEMARILNTTDQTLWRWVRAGRDGIPVYGAGRTLRFDPEEVLVWFRHLRERDMQRFKEHMTQQECAGQS